jgi:hypothetical protein
MSKQLPFKSAIIASMLLTLPFFNVKAAPSTEEAILKAPAYCPSKGTSDQWSKEWIQSVKLGSINNNSGNNGGYADFTVQSTNLSKGSTNAISVVPGIELFTFFDQTVRVWIDYNQNSVFDNAELAFSQTKSSVNDAPFTGSIVVPASALNGRTRMRVSRQRNGVPPTCGTFADGEVEDYSVNIVGGSTYCSSNGTSDQWSKEWIQAVKFGSISNNSGDNGGYANFTAQSTNLSKGSTNAISVVPGIELFTFFNQTVRVWIDYNQNSVFDNAELVFSQTKSSVNDVPFTGSIVVPASALNGRTRMRVSRQRNGVPPTCGTFADGEVEDYSVNIVGIAPTEKLEVNVFPIPAANELTVEMTMPEQGDYKITLTNQCGTEVFNNLKKSSGKNVKAQIPVSHLKRGIYQVKVQTKEGTFEKRIVVE